MSDHDYDPIHPAQDRGCHGIPHPPRGIVLAEPGTGHVPSEVVIHHWAQGPGGLTRTPRRIHELRDGSEVATRWRMRWFLGDAIGCTRRAALAALYDVIFHPRTGMRSGLHWARTGKLESADLVVSVIPAATTVCGAGAAGCYSWGFADHGKPVVELGVEYLGNDEFANLVNHELGHATYAQHDMYPQRGVTGHDNYVGVMGTWEAAARSGYYPPDHEIAWAQAWLDGKAAFVHDH
ncbi:MAG: hypothetical protein M3464_06045 [Chloroflexota bacterium]|nr:hypothetical protein [Chloroflexota bacterium]